MSRLNRNQPFATVHGGDFNHRYEQGGRMFDGDGNEVVEQAAGGVVGGVSSVIAARDEGFQQTVQAELQRAASMLSNLPPQSHTTIALDAITTGIAFLGRPANDDLLAELEDQSDGTLAILKTMEQGGKNRISIIRAIDELVAKRAAGDDDTSAARAAAAPPTAPAPGGASVAVVDQLHAQLGA